jgi:hypothetical protein
MYIENTVISPDLLSDQISRSFDPSLIRFDLPSMIENMKHERSWKMGELKSMILLKSPLKKILLTIMHKGMEIRSLQTKDSITFQVIEGEIKLYLGKERIILNKDELLTINENLGFKIFSEEESAFLLTLES